MSGGSWDYAYSKVQFCGEDLIRGDENRHYHEDEDEDRYDEDKANRHVLRIILGKSMLELAQAMRAIEWSDSGDTAEDAWVVPVREYLNSLPMDALKRETEADEQRDA